MKWPKSATSYNNVYAAPPSEYYFCLIFKSMLLKQIIISLSVFILTFVIFNVLPFLTVGHYIAPMISESKNITHCSLNYMTCFNSADNGDNFPSVLKNSIFSLFIFPILLPGLSALITFLLLKKIKQK